LRRVFKWLLGSGTITTAKGPAKKRRRLIKLSGAIAANLLQALSLRVICHMFDFLGTSNLGAVLSSSKSLLSSAVHYIRHARVLTWSGSQADSTWCRLSLDVACKLSQQLRIIRLSESPRGEFSRPASIRANEKLQNWLAALIRENAQTLTACDTDREFIHSRKVLLALSGCSALQTFVCREVNTLYSCHNNFDPANTVHWGPVQRLLQRNAQTLRHFSFPYALPVSVAQSLGSISTLCILFNRHVGFCCRLASAIALFVPNRP